MRLNQHGARVPLFPPVFEKEFEMSDYWWCCESYIVGKVTCLERRVRIINTLTRKVITMSVCEEDTINDIKEKYKRTFNSSADAYIWRKTHSHDGDKTGHLFMKKTLTQNDILYHKNELLGLPPALWLFFTSNSFCQQ